MTNILLDGIPAHLGDLDRLPASCDLAELNKIILRGIAAANNGDDHAWDKLLSLSDAALADIAKARKQARQEFKKDMREILGLGEKMLENQQQIMGLQQQRISSLCDMLKLGEQDFQRNKQFLELMKGKGQILKEAIEEKDEKIRLLQGEVGRLRGLVRRQHGQIQALTPVSVRMWETSSDDEE
jgi:hypothetical protein